MFIFTTILISYFRHVVTQDFAGAALSEIPIVVVPNIEYAPVLELDELVADVEAACNAIVEERPAELVASIPQVPIEEDVAQESVVDNAPPSSVPVANSDVAPIVPPSELEQSTEDSEEDSDDEEEEVPLINRSALVPSVQESIVSDVEEGEEEHHEESNDNELEEEIE